MSKSFGVEFTTQPVLRRLGDSWEPPDADPHVQVVWGLGAKSPRLPDYVIALSSDQSNLLLMDNATWTHP